MTQDIWKSTLQGLELHIRVNAVRSPHDVPCSATDYLNSPFLESGEVFEIDRWSDILDNYFYGFWDEQVKENAYEFDHEPLFTTVVKGTVHLHH